VGLAVAPTPPSRAIKGAEGLAMIGDLFDHLFLHLGNQGSPTAARREGARVTRSTAWVP
jgi:hypothetical protein